MENIKNITREVKKRRNREVSKDELTIKGWIKREFFELIRYYLPARTGSDTDKHIDILIPKNKKESWNGKKWIKEN